MTPDAIAAALARFVHPEQFTELRCLNVGGPGRTHSGWFDGTHLRDLARAALGMHRQASGCYFIPNPIRPEIAARRLNTVLNVQRGFRLTHDEDVLERRFLIVDLDPRRVAAESDDQGRPTTARELVLARIAARDYVIPFLSRAGYAPPVIMCSGNGVHLVYRYSAPLPLASWSRSGDPVAATLADLSGRFSCYGLTIDSNTYNPCRMLKVPGTLSRKGDSSPERPYRLSRIITVPDGWRDPAAPPAPAGDGQPPEQRQPNGKVGAKAATRRADHPALFDRGHSTHGAPVH